jgi:hypothetical protein
MWVEGTEEEKQAFRSCPPGQHVSYHFSSGRGEGGEWWEGVRESMGGVNGALMAVMAAAGIAMAVAAVLKRGGSA